MPEQLRCFDDFGLSENILSALQEMGFEEPTEVQRETFIPITEGKDLMVQARTGTGKTAAFSIPLADRMISNELKPQVLAICPTRELALQVAGELSSIGKNRDLRVATVYGGAAIGKQIQMLEQGVHAVVGTPGRLLDHMRRGTLSLDSIKIVVLDEADEMLSMGFEKDISMIIEGIPERRQTLLFSATIPREIQRLSQKFLIEPLVISLSDDFIGVKEIEHAFYMVSGTGRLADLVRILDAEDPDSAIVFCNTREEVQLVASGLRRHGFSIEWLSSDLSQSEREISMKKMRDESVRFLVATDVAARGIDISHVTHVINYSFPESLEVYIHRTGRTGRMGRTGWAISLITPRDVGNLYFLKLTYRITPIERELPTVGEMSARRECDLLAQLISENTHPPSDLSLSLARRVLHHVKGPEIIASLLDSVIEKGEGERAQKARRSRSAKVPEIKEEHRRRRTRSSTKVSEKSPADRPNEQNGEGPEKDTENGDDQDPSIKEIYVSVGRKDGVRPEQIVKILGSAGVERSHVNRIRIRDRSTFVGVRADVTAAAVSALDGARFGNRVAMAEPAKRVR